MNIHRIAVRAIAVAAIAAATAPSAAKANGYGAECASLIAQVEAKRNIPRGLLMAIAITESGINGLPNPYAMNIAGRSYHARSIQDMVGTIQSNWSRGVQSIDVGCMQINLKYHGQKFPRLTDLLDSTTNVEYGASFLISLATETGSWRDAVMSYHNRKNPARRAWYGCKVWNNYLRVSMAQTGFVPCGKTPTGSSTASVGSTEPIQIAGFNSRPISPTIGPLTPPGDASSAAPRTMIGDIEVAIPSINDRVHGELTIVGAEANIPEVVANDRRANAFRSVRPVDWSSRREAENSRSSNDVLTSNPDQSGFGRITAAN